MTGVEKRACTDFLKSAWFNRREDVLNLWQYLIACKDHAVSADAAWEAVYPGQRFQYNQWRHVQSFLLARIEQFLSQRAYEQTPVLSDLHLAGVLRIKTPGKAHQAVLRRLGEALDKLPRDHQYYHYQYLMEWERYAATESRVRSKETNLELISRYFDIYAISGKLRLACLIESQRAVYKVDYNLSFLPELLDFLQRSPLRHEPIIALYQNCYMALTQGNESDFNAFRMVMERLPSHFPAEERRLLLLLAVNYCIRRLNSGSLLFTREAFSLYKLGLDTGILIENSELGRFAYKNIAALGLKLGENTWVENFLNQYAPLLPQKYREAYYHYNMAKKHYTAGDYRQAMPLLAMVDDSDTHLQLDSRIMLLKMYCETDEWDALDALISSFKIFLLRKKKMVGYHAQHYLNTIHFVQKMIKLQPGDKKGAAKLRREVEASKAVLEKEWLLQKLERQQ